MNDRLHMSSYLIRHDSSRLALFSALKTDMAKSVKLELMGVLLVEHTALVGLINPQGLQQQGIRTENAYPHLSIKKAVGLKNVESNLMLAQVFGEGGALHNLYSRQALQKQGIWEAGQVQVSAGSQRALVFSLGKPVVLQGTPRFSN